VSQPAAATIVLAALRYFCKQAVGPGWALGGDAGHHPDPTPGLGISDAFRDAERCASALDEWLSGARGFDDALAAYQRDRDEHVLPMYEFTCQYARLAPSPPEMQKLFAAVHGNQDAMNGFVRVIAGVISPADFFSPENVGRIFAAAH